MPASPNPDNMKGPDVTETTNPTAGGFGDLDEFFDGALRLPWRGKTYVIEPPDWELGLKCQAIVSVGIAARTGAKPTDEQVEVLSDADEKSVISQLLGDVEDELRDDGAPWPIVRRFGITALMFFTMGEEAALAVWAGKAAPAQPANRAQRRAAAKRPAAKGTARKARQGSTGGTTTRARAKKA